MNIPLKDIAKNQDFTIPIPKNKTVFQKLLGVGIIPNKTFRVLHKLKNGCIVIRANSVKVALDGAMASQIIVIPVN